MSLKSIDMEGALRRLADRRIEEAMREGKFDNLAGMGKPLDLEPMPADENARLTWWAIRLLKNNDYTPDEVRIRKQIDRLKEELATASSEAKVVALVTAINAAVRNLNTLGTNAINLPVTGVSLDAERQRFRQRTAGQQEAQPASVPVGAAAGTRVGVRQCTYAECRSRNAATAKYCRRCGRSLRGRAGS